MKTFKPILKYKYMKGKLQIMICDNITVKDGILHFAGQNTVELAKKYGTPLYLLDEDKIREKCRSYKSAFRKHFGSFGVGQSER